MEAPFAVANSSWSVEALGRICERGKGCVQTGPFGSQLHVTDYVNDGVPVVMPVNLGDNVINETGIKRTSTEAAERLSRHRVQVGDIVMSRRGDLERRALVRQREAGWICGTGCLLVRVGQGPVDSGFATQYLAHPNVRGWLNAHAVGSTLPNLNASIVSGLPVVVPPPKEQEAIARLLGSLDEKIRLNRQMNQTLEETARAVFESWFVDFDPVVAKAEGRKPFGMDAETAALFPNRFVESELGPIPDGWGVTTAGTEFNVVMGQSPPGSTYNESGVGVPFYQGRADFGFRFPARRVFCSAPTRFAQLGDTLVTVRAPVGDINMASERCSIGRGIAAVRHKRGHRSYTYHSMASLAGEFAVFEGEGTLFGAIGRDQFAGLEVLQPPSLLADRFEGLAGPFDDTIESNERESATLAVLRDTLLPKLLSGEIRIRDAEKKVEAGL